jgi:hypothetical protein
MMTLEDAWGWYQATRSALELFARLGRRYWDNLPEENSFWNDDAFRQLTGDAIVQRVGFGLEHIDDFAVMILFSVFEAIVRERVLEHVEAQRAGIEDGLLAGMVDAGVKELRKKAFLRVLEVFKAMDSGLVEEVNQVRRYRNWVAHGRPARRPPAVDPSMARERLSRFLKTMPDG